MLLKSDQQLVDALPQEIREKVDGFSEHFALQTGFAWASRNEPLPQDYRPESVDVFVDGDDDSCVFVYQGRLVHVGKEFFADHHTATVVVAIEDIPRYVQVHGELIVDSLGGCILPEVLVSPAAQLSCLISLVKE